MILSFKDKRTEQVFKNEMPRGLPADILKKARYQLQQLHAASRLDDMTVPPGNKLHLLKGTRKGQHTVWINDKWRVTFRGLDVNALDVEITDYHDERK